ncbi:MAG: nuclear transport factor 2 family protein [Emcibacter sp.]|nr:nuclear transport factor 2 family protein [Emcibacter sp.]
MNYRRNALKALYAVPLALGVMSMKQNSAEAKPMAGRDKDILSNLMARQDAMEARQQIENILYLYARGWDRLDEEALRACFFEDSEHQHGSFKGKSHDLITGGLKYIGAKVTTTTHMITNPMIEISGDKAISECSFFAHHRRMNKAGTDEEDYFVKGRYLDHFKKRDGKWKISARRGLNDFERVVARADQTLASAPADQLGSRKPTDPLYEMLSQFHGES